MSKLENLLDKLNNDDPVGFSINPASVEGYWIGTIWTFPAINGKKARSPQKALENVLIEYLR